MEKMLFCHIGWMEEYQGDHGDDKLEGDFDHIKKEGTGYEVFNFSPYKGKFYGYVPHTGKTIDLNRIDREDAKNNTDFMEGVTVIWTSTRPRRKGGGSTIVGWYKKAKVFREFQSPLSPLQLQHEIKGYWIEASEENCKLLPGTDRDFNFPRMKTGRMGQSPIWYADNLKKDPDVEEFLSSFKPKVFKHIDKKENESSRVDNRRYGKTQDQKTKAEVEKAAIVKCWNYFEQLGYVVCSFEQDKVGWDLGAWDLDHQERKDLEHKANESSGISISDYLRDQYLRNPDSPDRKLDRRIEVKGLSGSDPSIELTPNEYDKFKKCEGYRLVIVVNARKKDAKLFICSYDKKQEYQSVEIRHFNEASGRWIVEKRIWLKRESIDDKGYECWSAEDGEKYTLSIRPKTGAAIKLKRE